MSKTKMIALNTIRMATEPGKAGDKNKGIPPVAPKTRVIPRGATFMATVVDRDQLLKAKAAKDYAPSQAELDQAKVDATDSDAASGKMPPAKK